MFIFNSPQPTTNSISFNQKSGSNQKSQHGDNFLITNPSSASASASALNHETVLPPSSTYHYFNGAQHESIHNNTTNAIITNTTTTIRGVDHWRSVLDNVLIEFLASLFIIMAEIMYADWTDPWTQLIPAVAICAAMICLKDGDCFFPDATPSVTLLMWSAGAYDNSWIQPCARITGQCVAGGVAIAMWRNLDHSTTGSLSHHLEHVLPFKRSHSSLFLFEMLSTAIEHMAAIYLFIPMLPMISQGKVRAKHHHETEAPELNEVMHAALAFAGIHWSLRLSFLGEMNPLATVVRACILWHGEETGEELLLMLWSETVGVLIAMVYIANYYAPRKYQGKFKSKKKSFFVHQQQGKVF